MKKEHNIVLLGDENYKAESMWEDLFKSEKKRIFKYRNTGL